MPPDFALSAASGQAPATQPAPFEVAAAQGVAPNFTGLRNWFNSAPLNIAFETGDGLGPDAKGDAFVAMHGSWNRNTRTGYKIVQLDFDASGKPTGMVCVQYLRTRFVPLSA